MDGPVSPIDRVRSGIHRRRGARYVWGGHARSHRRGRESGADRKGSTAVTDASGRYQLVDLRPGTYVVTFTLSGFNTVKRDGVAVSGSGTVTVDGEMRVGALEETITVTGEAPVVDMQQLDAAAGAQRRSDRCAARARATTSVWRA